MRQWRETSRCLGMWGSVSWLSPLPMLETELTPTPVCSCHFNPAFLEPGSQPRALQALWMEGQGSPCSVTDYSIASAPASLHREAICSGHRESCSPLLGAGLPTQTLKALRGKLAPSSNKVFQVSPLPQWQDAVPEILLCQKFCCARSSAVPNPCPPHVPIPWPVPWLWTGWCLAASRCISLLLCLQPGVSS